MKNVDADFYHRIRKMLSYDKKADILLTMVLIIPINKQAMEEVKKNLFNVIHDNFALANAFIIILFFENYNLLTVGHSLFYETINFKDFSLKPFIVFFLFIALTKVFWLVWRLLVIQIQIKLNMHDDDKIPRKTSVISFILGVLSITYLSLALPDPSLVPIDNAQHPFLLKLFMMIPLFTATCCLILSFFDIENDTK